MAGQTTEAPEPEAEPVADLGRYVTLEGLELVVVLDASDRNAERWTAIAALPDSHEALSAGAHKARWSDWLAWANLLQFLGLPEDSRGAVISGTSQADTTDHDDLWLRFLAGDESVPAPAVAGSATTAQAEPSEDELEELDLMDDEVRQLVEQVLEPDGPQLIAGFEADDGHPVEAAWPDRKVGVLLDGDTPPDGWDARPVGDWTADELSTALREVN